MFTKEQILNTPSRKHGIDSDKELSYRQQAANLIQDMGQRLSVYPLFSDIFIVWSVYRFFFRKERKRCWNIPLFLQYMRFSRLMSGDIVPCPQTA